MPYAFFNVCATDLEEEEESVESSLPAVSFTIVNLENTFSTLETNVATYAINLLEIIFNYFLSWCTLEKKKLSFKENSFSNFSLNIVSEAVVRSNLLSSPAVSLASLESKKPFLSLKDYLLLQQSLSWVFLEELRYFS